MVGHNLQRGRSREKVPVIAERQQKYALGPMFFVGAISPQTHSTAPVAPDQATNVTDTAPLAPGGAASRCKEVVNVADFPRNPRRRQAT
jgi:hypothetical protein